MSVNTDEAGRRLGPKASSLMSQVQFVLDTNKRTMAFCDEVTVQLNEYYKRLGEEKRREQERILAEFDALTKTSENWEAAVERQDEEIEDALQLGNKLQNFYIRDLRTAETALRDELEQKEAVASILETCLMKHKQEENQGNSSEPAQETNL